MDREWIELPALPSDTLAWEREEERAHQAIAVGKKIVWQLQLGLESLSMPFQDEIHFQALALSIAQFSSRLWPLFQEQTDQIVLYRGAADLSLADTLAHYIQLLCHRLPEEAPVLLLFDLASFQRPSEALQFLAKERFEHFQVGFRGLDLPLDGYQWDASFRRIEAPCGLVFPQSRTPLAMEQCDRLIAQEKGAFKILYEGFVEEWEGLEELWLLDAEYTPVAKRKLQGFEAAGGKVRGRGI